jgi:hypothetical protein
VRNIVFVVVVCCFRRYNLRAARLIGLGQRGGRTRKAAGTAANSQGGHQIGRECVRRLRSAGRPVCASARRLGRLLAAAGQTDGGGPAAALLGCRMSDKRSGGPLRDVSREAGHHSARARSRPCRQAETGLWLARQAGLWNELSPRRMGAGHDRLDVDIFRPAPRRYSGLHSGDRGERASARARATIFVSSERSSAEIAAAPILAQKIDCLR